MSEMSLVPGTLRGFRQWRSDSSYEATGLVAVNHGARWYDGVNQAKCTLSVNMEQAGLGRKHPEGEDRVPVPGCSCGFYGVYDPEPWTWTVDYDTPYADQFYFGVIEASGRVILHADGFRAEKARIVAVYGLQVTSSLLENYPGAEWFLDEREMLEKYPPQDITTLVPEIIFIREARRVHREQREREVRLMREMQAQQMKIALEGFNDQIGMIASHLRPVIAQWKIKENP